MWYGQGMHLADPWGLVSLGKGQGAERVQKLP